MRPGAIALGLWAWATIAPSTGHAGEPIGAARCGTCHVDIYRQWRSSAHARSLERLTAPQRADPTCRACHTLEIASTDPALEGVQCESCHGAGSEYAPESVMRDGRLARLLGLVEVSADTCRGCHEAAEARLRPTDWRALVQAAAHGPVPDEPAPPAPGGLRR